MQMRVRRVGDVQAAPPHGGVQGTQIPTGIDDQGAAIAKVEEVGAVAQSFIDQRYQVVLGETHESNPQLPQTGVRHGKPRLTSTIIVKTGRRGT
ncbi:hypothetical protein GCM10029978_060760 [Actinoallomurus acanthiterrae]